MKHFITILFLSLSLFSESAIDKSTLIGYSIDNKEYLSMGIFIDRGIVITSADFFYSDNLTKDITLYVNDTNKQPPVCFAKMSVKAVDMDRNLAYLEVENYLDVFCDKMSEPTPYHLEYMKNGSVDIFCKNCNYYPPITAPLTYTSISKEGFLIPLASSNGGYFYANAQGVEYVLGYEPQNKPKYPGTPYFGKNGEFYGIYVYGKYSKLGFDGALSVGVITAFLCELQQNEIIKCNNDICKEYEKTKLMSIIKDISKLEN